MPPAPAADWPAVLKVARQLLDRHGPMSRPDLWAMLVAAGVGPLHGEHGFRAAVYDAQRRGGFPKLPRGTTGPAKGREWGEDRYVAELRRHDEPTPKELHDERVAECVVVLKALTLNVTVRLSPRGFAVLARQGWGEDIVRRAAHALVREGLAELRYERSGLDDVPVMLAA